MNGIGIVLLVASMGQVGVAPPNETDYGWQIGKDNNLEYIIQIKPDKIDQLKTGGWEHSSEIPKELSGRFSRVLVRIGASVLPRNPPLPELELKFPIIEPEGRAGVVPPGMSAHNFKDVETPGVFAVNGNSPAAQPNSPANPNPSSALPTIPSLSAAANELLAQNSTRDGFLNNARTPAGNVGLPPATNPSKFNPDPKQNVPTTSLPLGQPTIPSAGPGPTSSILTRDRGLNVPAGNLTSSPGSAGTASDFNSRTADSSFIPNSTATSPSYPTGGLGTASNSQYSSTTGWPSQTPNTVGTPNYGPQNSSSFNQAAGPYAAPASSNSPYPRPDLMSNLTNPLPASNYPVPPNSQVPNSYGPNDPPYGYNGNQYNSPQGAPAGYPQNSNLVSQNPFGQGNQAYQAPNTPLLPVEPAVRMAANPPPTTGNTPSGNTSGSSRYSSFDDRDLDSEREDDERQRKRTVTEGVLHVVLLLSLVVNFYLGMLIRKLRDRYRSLLSNVRSQTV